MAVRPYSRLTRSRKDKHFRLEIVLRNTGSPLDGPLGGLERVDNLPRDDLLSVQMARQVAHAERPLPLRVRGDPAIFPGREFHHEFASCAPLDDGPTLSAVEGAPRARHQGAVFAFPNRCANHLNPLSYPMMACLPPVRKISENKKFPRRFGVPDAGP